MGFHIGWVMRNQNIAPDEIAKLWTVWNGLTASERTYRSRILGMTGDAKTASFAMARERFEASEAHTMDTRSEDEKIRDAKDNWEHWRGLLGHLSKADESALLHGVNGTGPVLWEQLRPTPAGLATLAALQRLAKVVERK